MIDATFRPIDRWPAPDGLPPPPQAITIPQGHRESILELLDHELKMPGAKAVGISLALIDREIAAMGGPGACGRPAHPGVILEYDDPAEGWTIFHADQSSATGNTTSAPSPPYARSSACSKASSTSTSAMPTDVAEIRRSEYPAQIKRVVRGEGPGGLDRCLVVKTADRGAGRRQRACDNPDRVEAENESGAKKRVMSRASVVCVVLNVLTVAAASSCGAGGGATSQGASGSPPIFPDASSHPGAANPDVTQANISSTICKSGFTKTVRPPADYTDNLKRKQMHDEGLPGNPSDYEEDHLISLELGGGSEGSQEPVARALQEPGGQVRQDRHGLGDEG